MRRLIVALAFFALAVSSFKFANAQQETLPFVVPTQTPVATATPLPASTPLPSNLTYFGMVAGEYQGGPSPTPAQQEANMEAFEALFPLTGAMAYELIYTFPGYWTNQSSTSYCNTTCPYPQDVRVVGGIARGRFPLFSYASAFPGMNSQKSLLSLLSRADLNNLGISTNVPAEQWDTQIDAMGNDLKAFPGHPVIRFAHEFNGSFTLEYLAAHNNTASNGDSIYSFPAIYPSIAQCPLWPNTAGCAATTTAQEGQIFQLATEYVENRVINVDGCTNCKFIWNPTFGGSNPFTLAQLDEFFPVPPCGITEGCITPVGSPGVYAHTIGIDNYSFGGTLSWSGVVSSAYNHYSGQGPTMGVIETNATNNVVQNISACSTYTPGSNTQQSLFASVLSQISTYNFEYVSVFYSWSAYEACQRDYLLDPQGQAQILTDLGNSQFSAMDASMASPRPTWTPFPIPT